MVSAVDWRNSAAVFRNSATLCTVTMHLAALGTVQYLPTHHAPSAEFSPYIITQFAADDEDDDDEEVTVT